MKNLYKISWYADRISPYLPEKAFKPVPTRLFGGIAYLIAITAGFLAIDLFNLNPLFNFLISIVLGFSFASIGLLAHEILHGTVVKKPWLRNLLGAIGFWPLLIGPRLWIKWHNMNHHAYTQDDDMDPDAWMSIEQFNNRPFIGWIYRLPIAFRSLFSFTFLTVSFTLHSTRMFFHYINDFKPNKRLVVWIQFILPWTTSIGLLFYIGPEKWLFAYLIPALIGNFIVMAYISTNHRLNPLVPVNDPLVNSLTVTVPGWLDVLNFNFSHHTEHHLFPRMNPKYYPLVKEQIKKMWPERYHEMPLGKVLISLWKTPRVYYNNTELIDPHKGNIYGSLGNGFDPNNVKYRKI
ncbi:acyl-CoA desaturase [Clostridium sp. OS1-26]|uniref:fatty acid desaturase family protein n=1 Tax=Clostridium sp. OS1-26 TaxID=3070681 RepID=UPI0027E170FD|nr:acyl-CoA desaturase [Clostridium sp. OS1-26]WML34464.1 acyl-CoA desaturase [Clostridium sp. OS1-26]